MPAKTVPEGWTKGETLQVRTLCPRKNTDDIPRWLVQQEWDAFDPGGVMSFDAIAYVVFYSQDELADWLEWWRS